ncbi:hypothetical protein RN001_014651 [Aquatica leii]|uniref:Uncharacterized protein n=1 Tax=Aquatica leii TaxID=1421715 RepID=A0AAN7NY34_9COLE|nr:hypothetical protein RN001_014651 [Aquatica leii]
MNNNEFMNGDERKQRLEAALEKLRTSEVNSKRIADRYFKLETIVNQELKAKTDENGPHKTNSKTSVSSTTSSKKSKKEKEQEMVQKRIFQFHDEVNALNELNNKSNSGRKLFLNALERTNSEVWKSTTVKGSVTKLEYYID